MAIEDYYTDDCVLLEEITSAGHGEESGQWNEILNSDFKGKIILLSANESKADDSNVYSATHKLVCSMDVNIQRGQRVKDKNTNVIYEIVWIKPVQVHHQKILLKEKV